MANYDKIKGLIATGDKQKAIGMLASILKENKDEAEAWLLLGDLIDDPLKKRDCYYQVLRLFPRNLLALAKLHELGEPPPSREPIATPKPAAIADKHSIEGLRQDIHFSPDEVTPLLGNNSQTSGEKTGYIVAGIVGVVVILLVLASASDGSNEGGNPLCGVLMLLAIVGGIYLWSNSIKNRGEVVSNAIQEQKKSFAQKSHTTQHSPKSQTVSCRACQHQVSRTAPSCPNCGELYPGLIADCPRCHSNDIKITPQGFSLGKAAAGAVVAGPLGVAGGLHGRKNLEVACSRCGRKTVIKSNEIG